MHKKQEVDKSSNQVVKESRSHMFLPSLLADGVLVSHRYSAVELALLSGRTKSIGEQRERGGAIRHDEEETDRRNQSEGAPGH